jgi:hypothetical protein
LGYEHSHHSQGYYSFLATLVPAFTVFFLLQVSASDDDGPVNSVITYSLVGGNQLGHFTIDPKKGKLQVAKALDWEQVSHVQAEQKCGSMAGPEGKEQTRPILVSRESPGRFLCEL